MLNQPIYINGYSSINPVNGVNSRPDVFLCLEPEYKNYLDSSVVRRLGRIQKMAMVAAQQCIESAENQIPEAIITGTGFGCLSDTDKFLNNMLENETGLHSPTSFIQSTHNTISGQIAIMLKCNGYNNTFSHRGLSFEKALDDAAMLLEENETENVMVGCADEMPDNTHVITQKINLFSKNPGDRLEIAGEGVHFFLISDKLSASCKGKILQYESYDGHLTGDQVAAVIQEMISTSGLTESKIDTFITGQNPALTEPHYEELASGFFKEASLLQYKHLTGEGLTASAFGVILALDLFKNKNSDSRFYNRNTDRKPTNVFVYNHFKGIYHSFFLIQDVEA